MLALDIPAPGTSCSAVRMRSFAFLSGLFLVLLACGGQSSPATTPDGSSASTTGASCDELAASARTEVQAAFEANATCTVDADCIDTGFSAGCFDSCARAVAKTGAAAVDAAKARVDAAQCKTFKDQGCKLIVPPCVPPEPPACVSGRCR